MSTDRDRELEGIEVLRKQGVLPARPRNFDELCQQIQALQADVKFLKADIKAILHAQSQYLAFQRPYEANEKGSARPR